MERPRESLAVVVGAMAIAGGLTLVRARRSGTAVMPASRRPKYNDARDDERAAAGA
jgi:hypothetical protein